MQEAKKKKFSKLNKHLGFGLMKRKEANYVDISMFLNTIVVFTLLYIIYRRLGDWVSRKICFLGIMWNRLSCDDRF